MDLQILENIRQLKRELLPNERLILFGSQARGDARPGSDWDLLLLLDDSKNKKDFEDRIFDFVMMGWENGAYLSIKPYTQKEWDKRKPSLFRYNVEQEGIEIE